MLEHKSGNISETRKDIEEKILPSTIATYLMCSGIFIDRFSANFLEIMPLKEFLKSIFKKI